MNTYIAIYANTNTNTNNSKMSLEDLHAVGHGLVVPILLSLSTPALRFQQPSDKLIDSGVHIFKSKHLKGRWSTTLKHCQRHNGP